MAGMTQHYLAGELSVILGQLQAVAPNQSLVRDVGRLRRDAETVPLTALGSVVVRALEMTDTLCWESLGRGDTAGFTRQAALGAEMCEFGTCAGLLEEED